MRAPARLPRRRLPARRPPRRSRAGRAARVRSPRAAVGGLVAFALVGLAALACGGGETLPYYDLVEKQRFARPVVETRELVFGLEETRPRLLEGWSADRFDQRRERPFVRSRGERSSLVLDLVPRPAVDLRLVCRPLRPRRESAPSVAVALNGESAGVVELARGLGEYRVSLPEAAIRLGKNVLSFEYSGGGPGGSGPPAIAWYRLEVEGGTPARGPPRADAARRLLELPPGSRLDFHLELLPGSALRAEAWSLRGARLAIAVQTDGGPPRSLTVASAPGPRGVELGVERRTPARLTLAVEAAAGAEDGADAAAGVVLKAPALWAPPPPAPAPAPAAPIGDGARRPNVLIYLVDTLRKDRLGCYGHPRPISPRLDELARRAVVFENAIGQSSWTRASVASLFTGLWPVTHGAIGRRDRLAPEAVTLAEILGAAGYRTAGFIGNVNVDRRLGFKQGFDHYPTVRGRSDAVNRAVFRWLDELEPGNPFFLYVHTTDPHDAYSPPEEYRRRLAPAAESFYLEHIAGKPRRQAWPSDPETISHLLALYDAEIAYNDASFGELLDFLEERGLLEPTLVVFLSDHGEEFFDHGGWNHGKNLHAETLDFPLVIRFPGQAEGRRVASPVQHIDVLPTLLDYLGLERPPGIEGRSVLGSALGEDAGGGAAPPVYSHLHLDGPVYASLVEGDWKLIQRRVDGEISFSLLYRWTDDPRETVNLVDELPVLAGVLGAKLEERLAEEQGRFGSQTIELDDDLRRELEALGYLN